MPALVLAVAGAGCQSTLVPGTAYRQALLSFTGTLSPGGALWQAMPVRPIVGLLWTDPLQRHPDVTMPAEWISSTVDAGADTFAVDVFRPPPPEAMFDLADAAGVTAVLALAEIVLIDDSDGDGTFHVEGPQASITPPERYLAASKQVISYSLRPAPAAQTSPLTLPGQSGYALVDFGCNGQLSPGTAPINGPVQAIVQPSQDFPDARTCMSSHGP